MMWLQSLFKSLRASLDPARRHDPMSPGMPSPEQMMGMIAATTEDEIDCGQAFELMHQYADLVDSGQDAAALLPTVHKHIEICKDCRQELEALLRAIHAGD